MHEHRLIWRLTLVLLAGCGGGGPTATPDPVVPKQPDAVLTAMTILLPSDTLVTGTMYQARVSAADQLSKPITVESIAWASGNTSLVKVDVDGAVLPLAPGTVTVSATVGRVTARRTLTILPLPPGPVPVSEVRITPYSVTMDVGVSFALIAALRDFAGRPISDRTIVWKSNNEAIALVSSDGTVTARSLGTTTIEAISESRTAAAQIIVRAPLDTSIVVEVSKPVAGLAVDDTVTITATARGNAPIDSVIATVGAVRIALVYGPLPLPPPRKGSAWQSVADISTTSIGPQVLVVTAYDALGRRGVTVVPIIHDPKFASGGAKPTGPSK
jgi:Bacterial Ig-like domain (group 2)